MKKLLLTMLLAGSTVTASAVNITFATEPTYPPFETTNSHGEIIGFDIDIANAICKEIKANCTFQNQSFDSLISGLKFKRFDAAISAMDITNDRAKQVSFSQPYYDSSASFIAGKDSITLKNAKTIGVQNGTTFQQYIAENGKQYQAKSYATLQSAVLDLKNGRIDIIFGDTAVLADWMKTDKSLKFVGKKVTDPKFFGTGMGIAVNKKNTALLKQLNKGLDAIKENGQYQKIYDKWMSGK